MSWQEFLYELETMNQLQIFWIAVFCRWLTLRRKLRLTFLPSGGAFFVLAYQVTSEPAYLLLAAGGLCVVILAILRAAL